ncbi:prostate transmembrane protein androgen induced 1 [Cricetulus griseus]
MASCPKSSSQRFLVNWASCSLVPCGILMPPERGEHHLVMGSRAELEFVQIVVIVVVMMVMVVMITCLLSHYKLSARSFISRHSQARRRDDGLSSEGCLWPSESTVSAAMPEPQVYAPPRPSARLAVPPFVQRSRFQPTYPYLQQEIALPPTISLSDGEEPPPYQGPCALQLRDPEQQLELNRESVRAPPNRTIFDSDLMDSTMLGGPCPPSSNSGISATCYSSGGRMEGPPPTYSEVIGHYPGSSFHHQQSNGPPSLLEGTRLHHPHLAPLENKEKEKQKAPTCSPHPDFNVSFENHQVSFSLSPESWVDGARWVLVSGVETYGVCSSKKPLFFCGHGLRPGHSSGICHPPPQRCPEVAMSMAEAAVDPSTGDNLEQTILQILSGAGGSVKLPKLVKECQVPKKTLNQVLYRLKKEGKVHSPAPATWCLGRDAPGDEAPAIPEDPTAQPTLASSCDPSRCETLGPQPNVLSPSCPVEVFPLLSGSERLLSPMDTFFFLQPQDPKVVGTTPGSPGLQLSAHQRPPQTTLRGTRGKGVWDHVHHRGFARISEARLGVRSQRLQMDKKCFIFQALTRLSQLHAHIRSPGDTVPSRSMGLKQSKTMPLGFISAPGYSQWVLGRRKPRALFLLNACPSLADERIIRFLETSGPHRALHIAKALGMKTAKEVNPHLYAMRNRHLLSYDGNTWMIYDSSRRGQELGPRPYHPLSLPVPEGPSSQDTPAGAWGAQHIHVEKSLLRRVQLGHGNEMSLPKDAVEHSAYSFSGSPPVSATSFDPGTSFNMQSPEPGAHPDANTAQKVHIKSCLLVDATIGNSNKMTIHDASEGGGVESEGSKEPKEDTDTSSKATPCRSCSNTPSNSILLTSELGTMTLGDSGPQTTEPVLREDGVCGTGSRRMQK